MEFTPGGDTAAANVLAAADMQKRHSCVVLAPACDGKSVRWVKHEFRGGDQIRAVMPELVEAVDHVVAEHNVDSTRLYITGHRSGLAAIAGFIVAKLRTWRGSPVPIEVSPIPTYNRTFR